MVAPPTLDGPGDMTISYANTAEPCVDDLSPPATCPPGAWNPTFATDVSSFQVHVTFPNGGLARPRRSISSGR